MAVSPNRSTPTRRSKSTTTTKVTKSRSTPKKKAKPSSATTQSTQIGASAAKKTSVDFRFQCDPNLRDQLNERLKLLRIERSVIMEGFIKEWLRQTHNLISAASQK